MRVSAAITVSTCSTYRWPVHAHRLLLLPHRAIYPTYVLGRCYMALRPEQKHRGGMAESHPCFVETHSERVHDFVAVP